MSAPSASDDRVLPTTDGPLLRLRVACPRCGSPPAVRITGALRDALAARHPGQRIATLQCQRRGCGEVYDVPARACHLAR